MTYREAYETWLKEFADDQATVDELKAIAGDEKEIEDRFYTELSFGTAGMRGVLGAGTNRMNIHVVRRAAQATADVLNAADSVLCGAPSACHRGHCHHRQPQPAAV